MSAAAVVAGPPPTAAQWAFRGAVVGAVAACLLNDLDHPWLAQPSPLPRIGILCIAVLSLAAGEWARSKRPWLSQGLAGAGLAMLVEIALATALVGDVRIAGPLLALLAAGHALLRLGLDAGLLTAAVGVAGASLLTNAGAGAALFLCVVFCACSRSMPNRFQILALLGISAVWAIPFWGTRFADSPELDFFILPLLLVPWLLHFGAKEPWRWTAIVAALALLWLWGRVASGAPWLPETALALAAGLLLLSIPLARRRAVERDRFEAEISLEPLLAAAVVAIASAVPLGMEPGRGWIGAALAAPLLGWVGWQLNSRWLWLAVIAALLTAMKLFAGNWP